MGETQGQRKNDSENVGERTPVTDEEKGEHPQRQGRGPVDGRRGNGNLKRENETRRGGRTGVKDRHRGEIQRHDLRLDREQ